MQEVSGSIPDSGLSFASAPGGDDGEVFWILVRVLFFLASVL